MSVSSTLVVDRAVAWCVGFVAATKSSAQPLTLAEAKPNTARELHTARKQEIIAGSQLGSGPSVVRPNASRSAAKAVAFDILECVQKKRTPQNESGAAREPHPEWQRCVAPQYRPRHSHLGHSVRQCTSSASTMDIDRLELPQKNISPPPLTPHEVGPQITSLKNVEPRLGPTKKGESSRRSTRLGCLT